MKITVQVFLFILLLASCAPRPVEGDKSKVVIRLPASSTNLSGQKASGSNLRQAKAINTINDINCYVIMVSYIEGEILPPPGGCFQNVPAADGTVSKQAVVLDVRSSFGSIQAGGAMEVEVNSGPGRIFSVIGFQSTLGYCPFFNALSDAERTSIGTVLKLGSTRADIFGEFVDLNIDISLTGSQAIDKCEGGPFNWEQPVTESLWDQAIWDQAVWGP